MRDPWGRIWPDIVPIINDVVDGVERCGMCGWEINNGTNLLI